MSSAETDKTDSIEPLFENKPNVALESSTTTLVSQLYFNNAYFICLPNETLVDHFSKTSYLKDLQSLIKLELSCL